MPMSISSARPCYLEMSAGSSQKFWEVSVKGSEMTLRCGRIDTNGQTQTKSFDSPAAAKAERDKLIAAKKRKGYE